MRDKVLQFYRYPAVKFAMVGGLGFLVDLIALLLFLHILNLELMLARILAFITAATSNWYFNRNFTFKNKKSITNKSTEWLRFVISAVLSAIPNIGLFYFLMLILPETFLSIIFAMCCGILLGYFSNYRFATSWVFKSYNS